MACPHDLSEMKELVGRDDALLHLSDEGGVWIDSADVNRMLLHAGMLGLDSMGGRTNEDAIGDRCPKDDVDLIVVEGGDKSNPLEYGICEVCGGIWLELGLEDDADATLIEEATVDFFRDFHRSPGPSRSARS